MARPSTSLPALRSVIRGTSDKHGLGQRVVTVMGEGEEHATGALGQGDGAAAPVEDHRRRLAALAPHFHLPPAHTHPQSRAQSLERRLLGGEAGGKMRNGVAPTAAVDDLLVGENAPQEPLIPALNDLTNPRDQRQIHPDAHDGDAQQGAIRPAVALAATVWLAPARTGYPRVTVRSPRKSSPPARRRYSRRAPAPLPRP